MLTYGAFLKTWESIDGRTPPMLGKVPVPTQNLGIGKLDGMLHAMD